MYHLKEEKEGHHGKELVVKGKGVIHAKDLEGCAQRPDQKQAGKGQLEDVCSEVA
jgi:hypothetical protein